MRPFFVVGVAFAAFACHPPFTTRNSSENLRLPVRVHLLTSPFGGAVATTWTERDVRDLFELTNRIWRRAGIEWRVEAIVREQSPAAAQFDSLVGERIGRTE